MDLESMGYAASNPDPTRLKVTVAEGLDGFQSLTVSFLVSAQQTMMADFTDVVHNTALRIAHERGHMPISAPFVTTEMAEVEPTEEGVRLPGRGFVELEIDNAIRMGKLVKISVEFMLGLSL